LTHVSQNNYALSQVRLPPVQRAPLKPNNYVKGAERQALLSISPHHDYFW